MHRSIVWDLDFWKGWLDDLARYRYNFLSLWNRHPFPALVELDEFPDVAVADMRDSRGLVKKMTVEQKTAFWNAVLEHAKARCIDVIWITWNVNLQQAEGKYGIEKNIDDEETRAYMRASVTQLFERYPALYGIGVTAGEEMDKDRARENEAWLFDVYGKAMLEVAERQPERHFLFMHR